jgi:hypothetical protein
MRSSTLLGIIIFLSLLVVHAPAVFNSPRFESDWTKTLVLSGGAFLLAKTGKRHDNSIDSKAPNPRPQDSTLLLRTGAVRGAVGCTTAATKCGLPIESQNKARKDSRPRADMA